MMYLRLMLVGMFLFVANLSIAQENEKEMIRITQVPQAKIGEMIKQQNDTMYIYYFWASWNQNAGEEILKMERLQEEFKDEKVKIILVSHDAKETLKCRIVPVLTKNKVHNVTMLMLEQAENTTWKNEFGDAWKGTYPFTYISYGAGDEKLFIQHTLSEEMYHHYISSRISNREFMNQLGLK